MNENGDLKIIDWTYYSQIQNGKTLRQNVGCVFYTPNKFLPLDIRLFNVDV